MFAEMGFSSDYNKDNPFIYGKDKRSSMADKQAFSTTVAGSINLIYKLVENSKESMEILNGWLEGTFSYGGYNERDFRDFISLICKNKDNLTLLQHPYITVWNRCKANYSQDNFRAWWKDDTTPEVFNTQEYFNCVCDRDPRTKRIIAFKPSVIEGLVDEDVKKNMYNAMDCFYDLVTSYAKAK